MHQTTSQDAPPVVGFERSSRPSPTRGGIAIPPRLLIVEDDPMTGEALRRLFRRLGWDVLLSGTVAGGLSLLSKRPDCVILDLNLPDGEGEVVLAAIRKAGLPTRVVVASGTTDQDLLRRVERLGPDRLLAKPVAFQEILRAFGVEG